MTMDTVYTALAAIVLAIPILVVAGMAVLLAVGGAIGCTRCLFAALTRGSEPATEPAKDTAKQGAPRYA